MISLHPSVDGAGLPRSADQLSDLSEKIWHELSEQVPLEQIGHLVVEAAAQFEGATVTSFIPLLIQRQVRERLNAESVAETLLADDTSPEDNEQAAA